MSFHSRRFGRAAATYGAHAQVQAGMADKLVSLLPGSGDSPPGAEAGVLELGCGTGLLTARLRARLPETFILATDASEPMLARARENAGGTSGIAFAHLDASGNARPPETVQSRSPYRLVASNALVQWFPALSAHLRMVRELLEPGGVYLVSGFLRDNFPELNALLREPPFGYREFPGHARGDITAAAHETGFQVETWAEDAMEIVYPGPEAFLGAIRGLGSSRRPGSAPMTRSRLEYLVLRYQERYACAGGVRATWKPWHARLSR